MRSTAQHHYAPVVSELLQQARNQNEVADIVRLIILCAFPWISLVLPRGTYCKFDTKNYLLEN